MRGTLPITVLIAARNEAINLPHCLRALSPARRVVVLDSGSSDGTVQVAEQHGAEVAQFRREGSYPKKRQWALQHLSIDTPWVMLVDADEVVPPQLWVEIREAVASASGASAFLITKEFHFMGRRFRFGGFSHAAVGLLRTGRGRFERLLDDDPSELDMEVHERLIVDGPVHRLKTPLIHRDYKGLAAYLERHNQYSTWEARIRATYFSTRRYGEDTIRARLFGNSQERRRFLKALAIRIPFEPLAWFVYHYIVRLGFLEGRRGLIACFVRAGYIAQVRAKLYESALDVRTTAGEQIADCHTTSDGEQLGTVAVRSYA